MKVKVSEASGAVLDWMVAKCEGIDTRNNARVWFLPFEAESDDLLQFICMADDEKHAREQCENAYPHCTIDSVEHIGPHNYSSDWAQGGPLIEREKIRLDYDDETESWLADNYNAVVAWCGCGPTPLIAAMRCYVTSKLGDEVEIPPELVS